jgi:hypothetical protein
MNSTIGAVGWTALLFSLLPAGYAQNSWTKTTSGYWEEPYWSFGVLPDFSQSGVLFANAGWKALGIRRETALNYPSSLHIQSLTVSSPTNSFNTLLLNFVGNEWPLRISGYLDLGSNSALIMLDSGLEVGDQFRISGTVTHSDYSVVTAPTIVIGYADAGAYNFTNGILNVSNELFVGYDYIGTLHQHGGSNTAGLIRLGNGSEYFLHAGDVTSSNMIVGQGWTNSVAGTGFFHQSGGRVLASNAIRIGERLSWGWNQYQGNGQYTLSGGTVLTPLLVVGSPDGRLETGANGAFDQSGGSNLAAVVSISGGNSRRATYGLTDGLLSTSGSSASGHGVFNQSGGAHLINGDLSLAGYYERNFQPIYAGYNLSNGFLRARNLRIDTAAFGQNGGTNEVSNELFIRPGLYGSSYYSLSGGRLSTSNTVVLGSYRAGFGQNGGVHVVSSTLQLTSDDPRLWGYNSLILYTLAGGQLIARDIGLSNGAAFQHTGGTISHSGILTLAGGQWQAAPGTHQFGKLQLNDAVTNSIFSLPDSAVVLRFGDSLNMPWQDGGQLVIQNWRGSTTGGGLHQIIFAGGANALGYRQRAKIVFREPAVFGSGDSPTRLLATGEIVPAPRVGLIATRSPNGIVFQWPEGFGFVLQTSTNIAGPWTDIAGAASPYTNQVTSGPRRFFRLRLYD